MQVNKFDPQMVTLIERAMMLWNTTLILPYLEGKIEIPGVKIRHGILQGDSLSPFLFCLSVDPLSNLINEQGHGYSLTCNINEQINNKGDKHLLFMDDLKLFLPNDNKLTDQLKLVKQYSEDIRM